MGHRQLEVGKCRHGVPSVLPSRTLIKHAFRRCLGVFNNGYAETNGDNLLN